MNDFEKIEDLLLTKRYEELSSAELREVNEYFESGNEYNDMRDTLMQVKSTLAADKLLIKPPVDMKENLLNKFQQTYPGTQPGNSIPFYKKAAFQWSAAASVVIILSLSIFGVLQNMGGNKQKDMAVNYEQKQKKAPSAAVTTDTAVSSPGWDGESGADAHTKKYSDGYVIHNAVTEEEELNKPVIQSNYYAAESTVTEGESYNNADDVKVNSQETKDESEKSENKSFEQDQQNWMMNTTIPQNGTYNSTKDNTTIDQKARITYQNKKNVKGKEEDKNTTIIQGDITNTTILGNTTFETKVALDSLKTDTNIDNLNRRAVNTQKADSLEKQN